MVKLLNNFWLKVIAVAAGLLLWVHVATEKTYTYDVTLEIKDIILDEGLTLFKNPAGLGNGQRLIDRQGSVPQ